MNADIARAEALGYVWGRQDAGESERDTGYSWWFAEAYVLRCDAFDRQLTWHGVPLQTAWAEWSDTKVNGPRQRLTYETRDGWREIVVIAEAGTGRAIDRETEEPPARHYV